MKGFANWLDSDDLLFFKSRDRFQLINVQKLNVEKTTFFEKLIEKWVFLSFFPQFDSLSVSLRTKAPFVGDGDWSSFVFRRHSYRPMSSSMWRLTNEPWAPGLAVFLHEKNWKMIMYPFPYIQETFWFYRLLGQSEGNVAPAHKFGNSVFYYPFDRKKPFVSDKKMSGLACFRNLHEKFEECTQTKGQRHSWITIY